MALVCLVDDGFSDSIRHLLLCTQMVVHPKLDDVDALLSQGVHNRPHLRRSGDSWIDALKAPVTAFEYKTLSGSVDACDARPAGALLLADLQDQVLIGAK